MKHQTSSDSRASLIATALVAVCLPTITSAATLTWDHDADGTASDGSGNWLDAGQWLDGVTPATWNNGTPDSALIGSGGTGEWTINLGAGVTVADATFDNYTGEYRLGSGTLTVNGTLTWGPNTISNGENKDGVEFLSNASLAGTGTIIVDGNYPAGKSQGQFNIRTSDNTGFTGLYDVRNGVLFTEGTKRPADTSKILLNGGPGAGQGAVYSSRWSQTLDRDLGAGAGEIQVLGNRSGFEGQGSGGQLLVRLNGTGPQAVQWGSADFDPSALLLQSPNSNTNGNMEFQTAIDLNGADRTIEVDVVHTDGNGRAQISRKISNSSGTAAGIIKTGPGRLALTDTSNDYDGPTVVEEGILQLGTGFGNTQSLPGKITAPFTAGVGSNLVVDNAMISFYFTFQRAIGTGIHDVQFTGASSGLTQRQGDRPTFVFGDSSTEVVWGAPGFDPAEFVINDPIAGPATTLRWQNPIDLNGADRTISTPSTTHGATLEENVRNTGAVAALIKNGGGTLTLQGTNTYDGGTTVNAGTVQFDKVVSMPADGVVTVASGSTLCVKVGGGGEWATTGTGHGTVDGLLNGLGGQSPSTIANSGNLCLLITGSQEVSNVISSSGDFFVSGGTLELSGDNTFTGDVVVDNGATLILSGDNSGATGSIQIINGFLEAAPANLPAGGVNYNSTGTNPSIWFGSGALAADTGDANDVYWQGSGGFASDGTPLTVTLNSGATIDWSDGNNGFRGQRLHLGSSTSTASVELTNDITLDGDRRVQLFNNSSSTGDISILSGDIVESGSRSLIVEGSGTLALTGNNAFGTSNRRLQIGNNCRVRAADGTGLPSTAVLFFTGGVFESSGTMARDISNASGNVYWNNQGGFAASGGPLTVTLQGGATIQWNQTNGGFRSQELRMGSETSDDVVTMTNDIELRGNRTIRTYGNPDTDADYTIFSGVLSNGDGSRSMQIRGSGTILYNNDNTYTGETRVHDTVTFGGSGSVDGKLRMEGNTKLSPGASVGTLGVAGNLELDPLAGNSNGKLLFELGPIAASDKIEVGGEINIGGSKLDLDDFEFTELAGLENGTYTLISGGAPLNGSLNSNTNGTLGAATIDLQISGSGTDIELVVSGLVGGSPYDTWATSYLPDDVSDRAGNNDGDTLVNLLEFGFGTNPTVSDSVPLNPDGSVNGLPILQHSGGGGGVTFDLLFVRRDDHGTSGSVTYTPQFSSDLVTFYDSAAAPTFVADSTDDAAYEIVKVPYPAVLPDGKKARFSRMKVDEVP